jgi:hypothetical protein
MKTSLLVMLACALALCGVAHAQQTPGTAQVGQAAPVGDPIRLKVSVIHAFKSEGLRGELTEAYAGYKGFKLLQSEELAIYDPAQPLGAQAAQSIKLPNGETAEFRHSGVSAKGQHSIRFSLAQAKVVVDLKAPLRKVFYQAGMKHAGGILILAMYLTPPTSEAAPQ